MKKPASPSHNHQDPPIVPIPLDFIEPSGTNQRFHSGMEGPEWNEFVESIRDKGIITPLMVRKHPAKSGRFQLIAGERRWTAAEQLKLDTVPARVYEATDQQALELQLIENLQRTNLSAIEEAQGFVDALALKDGKDKPTYTVETLAASIGKSPATIRARLKLLKLPPDALKAYVSGELNASIGVLLCRIPDAKDAATAFAHIMDHDLSFRAAKEYIQNTFMRRLKDSPFDQEDAKLVPKSGACGPCPFRTGNLRAHLPDIDSTDVCTNPKCYAAKCDANARLKLAAAAKEEGVKVLPAKPDIWGHPNGDDPHGRRQLKHYGEASTFVDLDEDCPFARGKKGKPVTWRAALGEKLKLTPAFATADSVGHVHQLAKHADVMRLVAPEQAHDSASPSNDAYRKEQAKLNRDTNLFTKVQRHIGRTLVEACIKTKPTLDFWTLLAGAALDMAGHDIRHEIINRRGLNLDASGKRITGLDETDILEAELNNCKTADALRGLLMETLILRHPRYSPHVKQPFDDDYLAVAKLFKVDIAKLTKEVHKQDADRSTKATVKKQTKGKK